MRSQCCFFIRRLEADEIENGEEEDEERESLCFRGQKMHRMRSGKALSFSA